MQERRSEVRILCADLVEVHWKDRDGRKQRASALLEDISPSGACLQTEIPVPIGTTVTWSAPTRPGLRPHRAKQQFIGSVRYCEYQEIGYYVGVEFDSLSKWSKREYVPQHLLEWKHLME